MNPLLKKIKQKLRFGHIITKQKPLEPTVQSEQLEKDISIFKKTINNNANMNITGFFVEKGEDSAFFTITIKQFLHRKILLIENDFFLNPWLEKTEIKQSLTKITKDFLHLEETADTSVMICIVQSHNLHFKDFFSSILYASGYTCASLNFPYAYTNLDELDYEGSKYEKVNNIHILQTENYVLGTVKKFLKQARLTYKMDFKKQLAPHDENYYFQFYFLGKKDSKFNIQVKNNTWSFSFNEQQENLPSIAEDTIVSTLHSMFQKEYKKRRLSYTINGDLYFFQKYFANARFISFIKYNTFLSRIKQFYGEKQLEELSFQHTINGPKALFTKNQQDHLVYGSIFDLYFIYLQDKDLLFMGKSKRECLYYLKKEQDKTHYEFFGKVEQKKRFN